MRLQIYFYKKIDNSAEHEGFVFAGLLKKRVNSIVVFEQINDVKQAEISGVKIPVLDELKK